MKQPHSRKKILSVTPDQIIDACRQKFINILPSPLEKNHRRPTLSPETLPLTITFKKDQVRQLIRQMSLFLQLLIQNCVLTSDLKIRSECLKLINTFRDYLSRDLSQFENLLSSRIKGRLPEYQVDCKQFCGRELLLRIPPQVSLYQDPLLFYIYGRTAQEELFCNHSIMMTREERIQILKNHIPFFNPLFIPLVQQRLQTKAKFTQFEDRLLQIVISSPRHDINKLRAIYFPQRPQHQIKNRIKNLCGNPKELHNPVKDLKSQQYLPLTEAELNTLRSAYLRLGPRWPTISRYYQLRTPQFLQAEFTQCPKLSKKRLKEGILVSYKNLKQWLEGGKASKHEVMQVDLQPEDDKISQGQEQFWQEQQPVFKIINNVTYLVEQL